MASKAILTCRPNSHPFQERILVLDQPVKIGRSVARSRPAPNNAIFDCKVLSRNHALFWYNNGKFYLQDTKSSNGTFINSQRLSRSGEESSPREVCSGDIVQFGVDVLENTRKVTHGCIIANVKLYLPDGKEAKPSNPTTANLNPSTHSVEDLYQLNQYIQEAVQREQMLEDKLSTLQMALESIWKSADQGWKALITEDKLLSRVENLEHQIQIYSKDFTEDKLRDELRKLQEDKDQYQSAAKDYLHKILQEKMEADQKYQEIKRTLVGVETEYSNICTQMVKSHGDIQDLAQKFSAQVAKNELMQVNYQELEEQHRETMECLKKRNEELEQLLDCHLKSNVDKTTKDIMNETVPVIELEINPKETLDLSVDEEHSQSDDKYQPPLSDEVQLKLVSQLQEITDKYVLNQEDIENSKFLEEDMIPDYTSTDSSTTIGSNDLDQEKELLKIQLEEAQLVAEQNKLMSEELSEQLTALKCELELKASLCDNRLKDELNLAKQECIRLESIISSLEMEIKILRESQEKSSAQAITENSVNKVEQLLTEDSVNKAFDEPDKNLINDLKNRISDLQEELVTVGTMYMDCHEERTTLNRQLKSLKGDHQALLNKPYSFLLITLPCLVAFLAFAIFYTYFVQSNEQSVEKP